MPTKRSFRLTAALAALLAGGGCRPANVLNALVPESGYRVEQGVAYGDGPRRRLDVYIPAELAGPAPVVVFFYGGSWQAGQRGDYRFVGEALTARGYVVVIPDYRLYPEVVYPGFIEDGAEALAWSRQEITRFGGDPERLVVMGHSAGAYIAAMLAYAPGFLRSAGVPERPVAFVGLAGPYDFLPSRDPAIRAIFDVPEPERTQPLERAGPDAPPSLLLHGASDGTVSPGNSARLAAKLHALEVPAPHEVYPRIGHVPIVVALAAPFRWLAPALDDVDGFIRARVAGGSERPHNAIQARCPDPPHDMEAQRSAPARLHCQSATSGRR